MKHFLTHVTAALALGLATTSGASGVFQGSTDFESMDVGALPSDGFFAGSTADASIVSNAAVAAQVPSDGRPANFEYAASRDKVLSVDADLSAPLVRKLNAEGTPETLGADSVYADMLVDFAQVGGTNNVPDPSTGDQILVYARETAENGAVVGTNLYVVARNADGTGSQEYRLTAPIVAGAWTRLVVKAVADVRGIAGETWPGFEIYLGGAAASNLCETAGGQTQFLSLTANGSTDGAVSSLAFAGTGSVDDLVLSSTDPEASGILFTFTWPNGLDSVFYTVDGVTNVLDAEACSATVLLLDGSQIALTGSSAYRTLSSYCTVREDESPSLSLPAAGVEWYFPQTSTPDQDGSASNPFEIADADDLSTLAALVQTTDCAGLFFRQVADIDFTGEAPFAGIGTYDAIPTNGTPFSGTYDGQGCKIMNIDFTQRNYGGVFNQVNGGTIKNLTVSNITCSAFSSGEFGFAIVGNAGNGATLANIVAEGVFASENQPGTHNMAGIVIRASAGGTGTLVKDCVNNATLYGDYTKIGGICAITQAKISGGVVTFDGCANNGAIHRVGGAITTTASSPVANSANGGFGGIVAYTADDTVVVNCSNGGTISVPAGSTVARVGEIVGWASSKTLADQGGNSGDAAKKLLGSTGATITGFQFATVDNGTATTVTALAKDTTYLLERNVAASETPVFTLAAAGDTISFDTALGCTFAGTVAAAGDLSVEAETVGTVTTYTAEELANDPWFTPEEGADATAIADSLSQVGLSVNTDVVQTTADYKSLVAYITNHVAGAMVPDDLTANQKTNAVLCFALGAASIPDAAITDGDVKIETVEPGPNGAVAVTVSIHGVSVGDLDTADKRALAASVVVVKAGTTVTGISDTNAFTVAVGDDGNGNLLLTVTPTIPSGGDAPASYFVQAGVKM